MQPDLFDRLADEAGDDLISIYLPTHRRGAEIAQDRIRLKNGLAEVENRMESAGWPPPDREERLSEALSLLDDDEFWQHQGSGLGVFVDAGGQVIPVSLPDEAPERVVFSDTFHVRPLLPARQMPEVRALVLTKGGVRLYAVSRWGAERVDADLPDSLDDVNWFVDREDQLQRHADRVGARHGHEGGYVDEDIDRFLRAVDDGLPDGAGPLVVLGEDSLAARFADISDREVLAPDNGGLADIDDLDEIEERAGPVVGELEEAALSGDLEAARRSLGSGDAVTDLREGLEAAVSGRLSHLIIDRSSSPVWGRFEPSTLEISTSEEPGPAAADLLDRLSVHALGTGAELALVDGPIDGHSFVGVPRF